MNEGRGWPRLLLGDVRSALVAAAVLGAWGLRSQARTIAGHPLFPWVLLAACWAGALTAGATFVRRERDQEPSIRPLVIGAVTGLGAIVSGGVIAAVHRPRHNTLVWAMSANGLLVLGGAIVVTGVAQAVNHQETTADALIEVLRGLCPKGTPRLIDAVISTMVAVLLMSVVAVVVAAAVVTLYPTPAATSPERRGSDQVTTTTEPVTTTVAPTTTAYVSPCDDLPSHCEGGS